ncbi:MAG: hypothetical protein R3Y22_03180 [Bacteroidales bacterium]
MKIKSIIFALIALMSFTMVSCSEEETEATYYLYFTVDPSDVTITVNGSTYSSSTQYYSGDEAAWTVSKDGYTTQTGTAVFLTSDKTVTVTLVATSTPGVTPGVTPDADAVASLAGTDYYVFALDSESYATIESKVIDDMRPDDIDMTIYVWDETYVAGTTTGPNFYGVIEEWSAFEVSTIGWSGLGLCVVADTEGGTKTVDLTGITEDYTLHIAMKSTDTATHLLTIVGGDGDLGSIAIGSSDFVDNGTTFVPAYDFSRDGEWNEIEIPMSEFFDAGLTYRENTAQTGNVYYFLSGGTSGTDLEYDAFFIYKKAE